MNRIEEKFKELREKNKKAFIAFLTCGYPDLKTTEALVKEFSRIGVDIIELGIPFSDPVADGVVIQESSQVALKNKIDTLKVFKLVSRIRKSTNIPLCLMTYYNPVFCFGVEKFMRESKSSGVDGLIIPDLPVEESRSVLKIAKNYNIDIIFFISPTTDFKRLNLILKLAKGFIYYVSLIGVTGPQQRLPSDLISNVKGIKSMTKKPVCVGFGISNREQVREIYKIADGAIVGSIIIKKIKENIQKNNLVGKVSDFVIKLKS